MLVGGLFLREFVPDYEYSEEVVQGGRATCYFDVFNGEIESGLTDHGASSVSITMSTNGPPQLLVMPIQPLTAGAQAHRDATLVPRISLAGDEASRLEPLELGIDVVGVQGHHVPRGVRVAAAHLAVGA